MNPTHHRLCAFLTIPLIVFTAAVLLLPLSVRGTEERVLTIQVSTTQEDGGIPLASMVLDIYRADGEKSGTASAEDLAVYKKRRNLAATLITDSAGQAVCSLSDAGGSYLICVQDNPAASGFRSAVFVRAKDSGKIVQLELIPEKTPDIQTDITTIQQKSDSFSMGQLHTWILRGEIPAGISNAREYTITDVLDHRLSYKRGSPVITLYTRDGQEIPMEEKYYTLTEEVQTRNGTPVDALQIGLTPEGMSFVAANLGNGSEKGELRVRFQAAINRNADMGTAIPNDSHLDYTNSAGIVYHTDSDIPEVHTGGIRIQKTDGEDTPLAGADYMIASEATQAELEDEMVAREVLRVGSKNLAVVFQDFYTADGNGGKRYVTTTDENGTASFYGLACGTYYLVESKAPEGYDTVTQPIRIEITQYSHLTENTVKAAESGFILPFTGGTGSAGITAVGLLLLFSACLLLLSNRKRRA